MLQEADLQRVYQFSRDLVTPDFTALKEHFGINCEGSEASELEELYGDVDSCKSRCLSVEPAKCAAFVRAGDGCHFLAGAIKKSSMSGMQFRGSCFKRQLEEQEHLPPLVQDCVVHVQSTGHISDLNPGRGAGMYFTMDEKRLENVLGRQFRLGDSINIRHLRTGREGKVLLWDTSGDGSFSSGSVGAVHGRWIDSAHPGYWAQGDKFEILDDCAHFRKKIYGADMGSEELINKSYDSWSQPVMETIAITDGDGNAVARGAETHLDTSIEEGGQLKKGIKKNSGELQKTDKKALKSMKSGVAKLQPVSLVMSVVALVLFLLVD